MKASKKRFLGLLAVVGMVAAYGCTQQSDREAGAGEKAGAAMDRAAEKTKAGADQAVEKTGEALENTGESIERTGEKMQGY